jgi:hypothetical protein
MTDNIETLGLLLGAAAFLYLGFHQFHLSKNVDELERRGKLHPDAAARVRKKPMRKIGWRLIAAGCFFVILAFVHFVRTHA